MGVVVRQSGNILGIELLLLQVERSPCSIDPLALLLSERFGRTFFRQLRPRGLRLRRLLDLVVGEEPGLRVVEGGAAEQADGGVAVEVDFLEVVGEL